MKRKLLSILLWIMKFFPRRYSIKLFTKFQEDDIQKMLHIFYNYKEQTISKQLIKDILKCDGWTDSRCELTWLLCVENKFIEIERV